MDRRRPTCTQIITIPDRDGDCLQRNNVTSPSLHISPNGIILSTVVEFSVLLSPVVHVSLYIATKSVFCLMCTEAEVKAVKHSFATGDGLAIGIR